MSRADFVCTNQNIVSSIRGRQPEERHLKRFMKRLVKLSSGPSASTSDSQEEVEDWKEGLLSDYYLLIKEMDRWKTETAFRIKGVSGWAEEERQKLGFDQSVVKGDFETDKIKIERACEETVLEIEALKVQLEQAISVRSNKLEYNALARQINSHPSRSSSLQTISRLEKEIAELQSERDGYGAKWAARRVTFDAAVATLNELGDVIKEEKFREARRLDADVDYEPEEREPEHEVGEAEEGETTLEDRKQNSLNPEASPFIPKPGGMEREPGETGDNTPIRNLVGSRESSVPPRTNGNSRRRMVDYADGDKMDVDDERERKRSRAGEEDDEMSARRRHSSIEEGEMET